MSKYRFSFTLSVLLAFVSFCPITNHAGNSASLQMSGGPSVAPSPESTVVELYKALSFASGSGMDRGRVRSLFAPDARITFAGPRPDGSFGERTFTVDSFLDFATPAGETASREEKELWRRVERFGNIAHVFSAYELSFSLALGKPIVRRGINSVQLSFDGSRWRIVSLIWDVERSGNPLPSHPAAAEKR